MERRFSRGYRSLFITTSKVNRDEGIGITRSEYKDGFSLFGFDLSPTLCVGGHQEFKKTGNLRVSLEFGQSLQTLLIPRESLGISCHVTK